MSDVRVYTVTFDQCMLGLKGPSGGLHRKRTTIVTSSKILVDKLRKYRCSGRHVHEPVIGGTRITRAAAHYPPRLANLIVECLEEQRLIPRGWPGHWSLLEPVPKWSRRLERSSVISVRNIENLELIDLHPFRSPETSVIKCTWISS